MTQQEKNKAAFLYMLSKAEGTCALNGYRYLFGSRYDKELLFEDMSKHPKIYTPYTDKSGKKVQTSAAGRYQFVWATWEGLRKKLNLPNFSPESQDKAALELIRQKQAIPFIEAGKLFQALELVRTIWASLPGSGNNQPERKLEEVRKWYIEAGGSFTV